MSDANQEGPIPLSFYGLNYLGRGPFSTGIQGQSPEGMPSAGLAAIPSGGAGAGGASPAGAPAPSPGGPKSGPLQAAQEALQAVGAVQNLDALSGTVANAADGFPAPSSTNPGSGLPASAGAGGSVGSYGIVTASTPTMSSPGLTLTGEAMAPFPEVGATASSAGAAETGTAAAGTAAGSTVLSSLAPGLAAGGLESLGVSLLPQPVKGGVEVAQSLFNPATSLLFPDLLVNLFTNPGAIFGGPPPAMNFPASTWSQIQSQVGKNTPPLLPKPANATPEQQQAIEQANTLINHLNSYTGPEPSFLSGKQSAQTWGNTLTTMTDAIKSDFSKLSTLYPEAYQAFLSGQPQTPAGAPAGLVDALSTPLSKAQAALQAGDFATAAQLLPTVPDSAAVQALMRQYGPQLDAARTVNTGFYRGDTKLPHAEGA